MAFPQYPFEVFVSYAGENRPFARHLAGWLRAVQCNPWVDEEQIVPGSRWRAALQQGIRDSHHLLAVLTPEYVGRPWTERELDLFDLTADHVERRVLAVQIGPLPPNPLDQVFEVSQRIPWQSAQFDAEGFWCIYCGLRGHSPGPREGWAGNAETLLRDCRQRTAPPAAETQLERFLVYEPGFTRDRQLLEVAFDSFSARHQSLLPYFRRACDLLPLELRRDALDLVRALWAYGFAEPAALLALAALPQIHTERSAWPFVDLGCQSIADGFLLPAAVAQATSAEIWFAWGLYTQNWEALPALAQLAPEHIAQPFLSLAGAAATRVASFYEFEATFDYGGMIAPWNHFQLAWLAVRLGETDAAIAHAEKLCTTSAFGEVRTGRFLNRLLHWPIFEQVSTRLAAQIDTARARLNLSSSETSLHYRAKLLELWSHVAAR